MKLLASVLTLSIGLYLCGHAGDSIASRIYQTKNQQGNAIFSDAPLQNDQYARTSYKQDFGRPVAQASCKGLTADDLAHRSTRFATSIRAASARFKVDPGLVSAIAQVESCFDPMAVSRVGAQGLMQLMPATANELGVSNPFDALQNLSGGASYIAQMLRRYDNNHELALAAYNAGPGSVDRYQGIPPYPETQSYVKKVLALYSP